VHSKLLLLVVGLVENVFKFIDAKTTKGRKSQTP